MLPHLKKHYFSNDLTKAVGKNYLIKYVDWSEEKKT